MTVRRLIAVLIVAGIAVGGTWACGSDSTSPSSIAGTYNLQTIDGQSLPVVVFEVGTDKVEITAGFMLLNSDQTFSESVSSRITDVAIVTTDVEATTGSWTLSGSDITFTATAGNNAGDTFVGSISGNTLTFVEALSGDDDVTLVLRK
jgi:hypothetical protein